MIKRITKLTMVMLLIGPVLAFSVMACQSPSADTNNTYGNWEVDWNGYNPGPSVSDTPNNGGGDTEEEPPTVVNPVTYTAMIKSNTNALNVRSTPSTGGQVLGTLDKGDMVRYEDLQNGWYKTVYKERTAYVSASHASVTYMQQASDKVESVISVGEELLGYPYVWGSQRYHWGNGVINSAFIPGQFDCSALMQYIFFKGAGVVMDLNTRTQVLQGVKVDPSDLQRGDVMFFTNDSRVNNTGVERVGHVALYLGNNYILHTASDHAVIEEISAKRWSYFIVAKRFV